MKKLKIVIVALLAVCAVTWGTKTLHDYLYQIELDNYYAHRAKLQKEGYNWKEANHIAMVEGGWFKRDSLYYALLTKKKK